MVTTFTYKPILVRIDNLLSLTTAEKFFNDTMHIILSYRGNRFTNKHTQTDDQLQYPAPLSLAHSVKILIVLPAVAT